MSRANPALLAGHTPSAAHSRPPGEHHWSLEKDTDRAECVFRLTIDVGCEAQLFKNGELVVGQLFATRAQAEAWAAQQRERLIRQDWQAPKVS